MSLCLSLSVCKYDSARTCTSDWSCRAVAVRTGDLKAYGHVVQANAARFRADDTHSLIHRLRPSVIKTGVRKMSLSYSRISLTDLAAKLGIDTAEEAEYIVAKVRLAEAGEQFDRPRVE